MEPSQDKVVPALEGGGRVDKLDLVPSPKTRASVNTELLEGRVREEELAGRLGGKSGGKDVWAGVFITGVGVSFSVRAGEHLPRRASLSSSAVSCTLALLRFFRDAALEGRSCLDFLKYHMST
jgi:hypothetical protein